LKVARLFFHPLLFPLSRYAKRGQTPSKAASRQRQARIATTIQLQSIPSV
jgi:hypothetical protein